MATLYVFFLLSAASATFGQTLLQATQQLNILPATTSVSKTPNTEAISAFSQLKQATINSPFQRFFKYSSDSDGSNNGKNDNNSSSQMKPVDLNSSQKQFQQTSTSDDSNNVPNNNSPDSQLEETDLNSPILSKFAEYNLQVQMYANIYPRLYNVSLSPVDIRENFYNEAIYFALENGVYKVGSLPQQLADAAANAFPSLTPLSFFKVISNALELSLQRGGIAIEKNYQTLARINAKDLKDAVDLLKVNDARSALHAIVVGSGTFFKSLSLDYPEEIRYIISTLADQFSKVLTTGSVQQRE